MFRWDGGDGDGNDYGDGDDYGNGDDYGDGDGVFEDGEVSVVDSEIFWEEKGSRAGEKVRSDVIITVIRIITITKIKIITISSNKQ